MELMEAIKKRQSIRRYTDADVPAEAVLEMIEAARLAPSGKNAQNWHFIIVRNKTLMTKIANVVTAKNEQIAKALESVSQEKADRFRRFLKNFTLFFLCAPVLLVVMTEIYVPSGHHESELAGMGEEFLRDLTYKANPGMQSVGAAISNLTLRATDLGYGTCWLTSANYASAELEALLKAEAVFDRTGWYLAALISIGTPEPNPKSPPRKPITEIYTLAE